MKYSTIGLALGAMLTAFVEAQAVGSDTALQHRLAHPKRLSAREDAGQRALEKRFVNTGGIVKGAQGLYRGGARSLYEGGAKMLAGKPRPQFANARPAPAKPNYERAAQNEAKLGVSKKKQQEIEQEMEQQKKNLPLLKKLGGLKSEESRKAAWNERLKKHDALYEEELTQKILKNSLNEHDKAHGALKQYQQSKANDIQKETDWEKKHNPLAHVGRKMGLLQPMEKKQGWKGFKPQA